MVIDETMRSTSAPLYDHLAPDGVPVLTIDPFDPEILQDPWAALAELRAAGPIAWLSRYNVLAIARYREVRRCLTDWRNFGSARGVGLEDFSRHGRTRLPSLLLEADPPEHDHARAVLHAVLTPDTLASYRSHFVAVATTLVDKALARATIDGVADLVEAFPLAVFPDALGIGPSGRALLLPHADAMFNSFGPNNALTKASRGSFRPEFVEACGRLENLMPDSLGARVHHEAARRGMDASHAGMLVRALLQAGLDTTVNALGVTLHQIARNPDVWRAIRENPDLAVSAFQEAIRLESPVQIFFRTTMHDVEFGGITIPAGRKVMMSLAGANRDPARFDRADEFDLKRPDPQHVGFGAGIHMCVGQMIARMEADILLRVLAERVVAIEPAGDISRKLNNTVRGIAALPLTLRAA